MASSLPSSCRIPRYKTCWFFRISGRSTCSTSLSSCSSRASWLRLRSMTFSLFSSEWSASAKGKRRTGGVAYQSPTPLPLLGTVGLEASFTWFFRIFQFSFRISIHGRFPTFPPVYSRNSLEMSCLLEATFPQVFPPPHPSPFTLSRSQAFQPTFLKSKRSTWSTGSPTCCVEFDSQLMFRELKSPLAPPPGFLDACQIFAKMPPCFRFL